MTKENTFYDFLGRGERLGKKTTGKKKALSKCFSVKLADRTGLEPATPGVTGRYSNQLNYRSASSNLKHSTLSLPTYLIQTHQPNFQVKKLEGGTGIEPVTLAL